MVIVKVSVLVDALANFWITYDSGVTKYKTKRQGIIQQYFLNVHFPYVFVLEFPISKDSNICFIYS